MLQRLLICLHPPSPLCLARLLRSITHMLLLDHRCWTCFQLQCIWWTHTFIWFTETVTHRDFVLSSQQAGITYKVQLTNRKLSVEAKFVDNVLWNVSLDGLLGLAFSSLQQPIELLRVKLLHRTVTFPDQLVITQYTYLHYHCLLVAAASRCTSSDVDL